jgi:hypothetical protein
MKTFEQQSKRIVGMSVEIPGMMHRIGQAKTKNREWP